MRTSWINCLVAADDGYSDVVSRASDRPTDTAINNTTHVLLNCVYCTHTHCQLEGVRNQWNSGRCRCSYDASLWHLDLRVSDNGTMDAFSLSFFIDFGISLKSTCLEINNTVACPVRVHFAPRESPSTIDSNNKRMTLIYLSFLTIALFVLFHRTVCACACPRHSVAALPFIANSLGSFAFMRPVFAFVFNENETHFRIRS